MEKKEDSGDFERGGYGSGTHWRGSEVRMDRLVADRRQPTATQITNQGLQLAPLNTPTLLTLRQKQANQPLY